ncbi:MAG: hypothetical protein Q4C98_03175 [Capnocytophaga sp.]|nr:hypothetical protein [Capnocytophaga sp.]
MAVGFLTVQCTSPKKILPPTEKQVTQGEIVILYYENGLNLSELNQKIENYKAKIVHQYKNLNGMAISIPKNKTTDEAITYFSKIKGVLQVVKNEMMELHN